MTTLEFEIKSFYLIPHTENYPQIVKGNQADGAYLLIPALSLGQPTLYVEFQASKNYIKRPHLK